MSDLDYLRWQQAIRAMALEGRNHFPTLEAWQQGQTADEVSLYYTQGSERDPYHQWCAYLKAGIFQGIAVKDYGDWKHDKYDRLDHTP